MANKFNMLDLLNNNSKEESNNKSSSTVNFKTIQININDLVPSKDNFYSTDEEELKSLKDSIEMFGVQQNLVVKKIENNKYEIIAGHRRYLALKKLFEEGKKQFEYAPCKIESEDDSIKDKLLLLITNSTARELTDWEKTQQAGKIKDLLIEYKKKEKLPGRVREIIADILNTSPTQIARMERVSKNLTEEFKQEFKEDKVNISAAYEISKLPQEKQKEVFKEYEDKGNISIKDVKKRTEEVKEEKTNEENKNIVTVNTATGEIVEQTVPAYMSKSVFESIKDMTIDEIADFICSKCSGGNGCAGFCDLAITCIGTNKHETCVKWLKTKT